MIDFLEDFLRFSQNIFFIRRKIWANYFCTVIDHLFIGWIILPYLSCTQEAFSHVIPFSNDVLITMLINDQTGPILKVWLLSSCYLLRRSLRSKEGQGATLELIIVSGRYNTYPIYMDLSFIKEIFIEQNECLAIEKGHYPW